MEEQEIYYLFEGGIEMIRTPELFGYENMNPNLEQRNQFKLPTDDSPLKSESKIEF